MAPQPELEITFQARGLQWDSEWNIERLLALPRRYPGLKARHTVDQDSGQARLFFTCGKNSARKDEFAEAIKVALDATPCVLSVDGRGRGFKDIRHRSRQMQTHFEDIYTMQPEFGHETYYLEFCTSWRSACRGCPKIHDRDHECCRLAASQPASTGLYESERGPQLKLSDACLLERFRSVKWPVPGSVDFSADLHEWFGAARFLGARERNNELKRRVNAAVFHVLRTAKILLRAKSARLPPELLNKIVGYSYSPVLTPAQFDKLLKHATNVEETQRVARVLYAAARARTPRVPAEVFGENRRLALRDEWLWNGGFVWARSYNGAQRELGVMRACGDQGVWPSLENREAVLDFLWFAPPFYAAWPYDDEGRSIDVVPHTDPEWYPPWPKGDAARTVVVTIEGYAPVRGWNESVDSEEEEFPEWKMRREEDQNAELRDEEQGEAEEEE